MTEQKLFSLEQAERMLPLVQRIVDDVMRTFEQFEGKFQERQALGPELRPGTRREDQALEIDQELQRLEGEILRFQTELAELGVELKDFRQGLVDFRSQYEGRPVYLCWKRDEGAAIGWWHDREAGFAGRQPITTAIRDQFKS